MSSCRRLTKQKPFTRSRHSSLRTRFQVRACPKLSLFITGTASRRRGKKGDDFLKRFAPWAVKFRTSMLKQLTADSLQLAGGKVVSFKELIVWQRAMELAKQIYRVSRDFPSSEQYGLTSQMRRSAVSIPSNIAEGRKPGTRKDFMQFLRIADGSAAELETQIILAGSFYKLPGLARAHELLIEVQKMLGAMLKKLSLPAAS